MTTDAQELDGAAADLMKRGQKMFGQLGNWIMAANAGGLAFILATAREASLAERLPLHEAYVGFLIGLMLGIAGHLIGLFALFNSATDLVRQSIAVDRLAELQAKADGLAATDQTPSEKHVWAVEHNTKLAKRIMTPTTIVALLLSGILYLAAAACAASGLAFPLTHNVF